MRFRKMQIDDHGAMLALWQACDGIGLRDSDSLEGIGKYLERNPGLSFVAQDDSGIVGTVMAGHDGKRGYIQHLAVADSAREAGIGGKLVALCLDALKAEGIVKSHVHVIGHNQLGRQFWLNRGWHHRPEIELYSFINGDNDNA